MVKTPRIKAIALLLIASHVMTITDSNASVLTREIQTSGLGQHLGEAIDPILQTPIYGPTHIVKCKAHLLLDTNLSQSIISNQTMVSYIPRGIIIFQPERWKFDLVAPLFGLDINPFELTIDSFKKSHYLKVCELISNGYNTIKACSHTKVPLNKREFSIKLYGELELSEQETIVRKSLIVSCSKEQFKRPNKSYE